MVSKRYFLHISGFDPYDAAAQHRRFVREAARFAATWNVAAEVSAPERLGASGSRWTVTCRAPGWQAATEFQLLDWSDIVRGGIGRPASRKLLGGLAAFADLVRSGTAWRYFTANWRYGMFFLVPFLNVFLFCAAAVLAGCYAGAAAASVLPPVFASIAGGVATGIATAAFVLAALMRFPGERWRVGQAMADWIFARDYMLGRCRDMDARIDGFAERIVACVRSGDAGEIVIAGHSLGAAVAVDALTRAFARDPGLGRRGPSLALLTVGAVIPKIALHPRGAWLREKTRRLAVEPSLTWAEYQARDDFISFYKFHPVELTPVDSVRSEGGLIVHRVQIHQMLNDASWRRLRFRYMRMHYQFVMANERRAAYDYFMLMCGPASFRRSVTAPDGPAGLYGADGSCTEAACADVPSADAPSVVPVFPTAANG